MTVTGNSYSGSMLRDQTALPAMPAEWANRLRTHAADRAGSLRMPTTRDEAWRFTDISPLNRLVFQPSRTAPDLQIADISPFFLPEATTRLVFVDGLFAPHLSVTDKDAAPLVMNLPAGMTAHAAVMESYLGNIAEFREDVFAALNTAFLRDGALIVVPPAVTISAPVHLLFITARKEVTAYPRCLLVAGQSGEITVIEDYVTLHQEACVTNAVTEVAVAGNARVRHVRVQRESKQAFHIASCGVSLARSGYYQSVSVALGAQVSRYNLTVQLTGEYAECVVDGVALIGDRQLADTHTCIDHMQPNGISRQLHKCIADDAAHAVFNGRIVVRPQAQGISSSQSSRNLLLTGKAHVDTKPQLEIFADDVRCSHGATVGQLDQEEMFYLRSRGLSEKDARNLLTYAFGAEIIDRIPVTSLKERLERTVLERTCKD